MAEAQIDDDLSLPSAEEEPVRPVLTLQQALAVCQFTAPEIQTIITEAIPNWSVFLRMKEKDITSMAEDYAKRTIADGRIVFGFYRTKELQGLMHWTQDMKRMSLDPTDQMLNPMQLALASANADIRKNLSDNMETASKAADPGKLKTNTDWYTWSQGFTNYLSTIPGCTGIPLSYVVRENDEPLELEDNTDYLTSITARAPLTGTVYVADRRQVHQLLTGKVLGEQAEEWIRDDKTKQNGRIDYRNLLEHYEGEGNVSRRITQAENLHKTLYYKQERSLKFTVFLNRLQTMFQIYKQEGEEKPESAKIRFLLDRVQAPHLQQAIINLRYNNNQGLLTYASAKNTLMTEVVKTTDFTQNDGRSVAATGTGTGKDTGKDKKKAWKKKQATKSSTSSTSHGGDQFIDKGQWSKLSREQQAVIRKYRDDHGLPGGNRTQVGQVSTSVGLSDADVSRIVAAISSQVNSTPSTISSVSGSAGTAFGGKSEATQRKVT